MADRAAVARLYPDGPAAATGIVPGTPYAIPGLSPYELCMVSPELVIFTFQGLILKDEVLNFETIDSEYGPEHVGSLRTKTGFSTGHRKDKSRSAMEGAYMDAIGLPLILLAAV